MQKPDIIIKGVDMKFGSMYDIQCQKCDTTWTARLPAGTSVKCKCGAYALTCDMQAWKRQEARDGVSL